jgi:hypothetical protein
MDVPYFMDGCSDRSKIYARNAVFYGDKQLTDLPAEPEQVPYGTMVCKRKIEKRR